MGRYLVHAAIFGFKGHSSSWLMSRWSPGATCRCLRYDTPAISSSSSYVNCSCCALARMKQRYISHPHSYLLPCYCNRMPQHPRPKSDADLNLPTTPLSSLLREVIISIQTRNTAFAEVKHRCRRMWQHRIGHFFSAKSCTEYYD